MWKTLLCLICALSLSPSVLGQASPTATRRGAIQVGVAATTFSLDYGEGREEGIMVYGDIDFNRHIGVEALYRNVSLITPRDIGENHFMVGPRFHLERGIFAPYAKVLIGRSTINFQQGYNVTAYSNSYLSYGLGGGLDIHATRHINIRAIDFEYQRWPNFPPHGLTPYGASIGAAYVF